MREFFFLFLANGLPRLAFSDKIRYLLYRAAGLDIKGRCLIWGPLTIRPIGAAKNIKIGNGTFLNTDVRFGVPKDNVEIGSNVQVGPGVMFETAGHRLNYEPGIGRGLSSKPIVIEDEVWIGGGVIVTQGVTIGKGAVVAAGSVVTKDVESMSLVAGVPAQFIKRIAPS